MLSLLVAVPLALALQPTPASISGQVRRADTGEPIVGAVVAVPELARESRTDERGRYSLPGIAAGPRHLSVRSLGFAPQTLHALVPRTGALEIDVTLTAVPQRLAEVTVRQALAARGVDDSSRTTFPDRTVRRREIDTWPLMAERDPLLALSGGEVIIRPEMPSGLHIRGASADQTAYRLDGVPVLNPLHAAGMVSAWNPDGIASVRIASTLDDARTPGAGGVVAATTLDASRVPGHVSASVGTTQSRLTLHGLLGVDGGYYLIGVRSNATASAVARREGSYIRNEASDAIAKLELPVFGGHLRMLDVRNDDEIQAPASIATDGAPADTTRNVFEWGGRSSGLAWSRATARGSVRVQAWQATSHAGAKWGEAGPNGRQTILVNRRRDDGVSASIVRAGTVARTSVGVSVERSATVYGTHDAAETAAFRRDSHVLLPSAFAHHSRSVSRTVRVDAGASATALRGTVYVDPRVGIRWSPAAAVTLTSEYARLHQFAQSLRNDESVVGSVFPAELFVNAGSGGVPVAESELVVVGVDARPAAGVRLAMQAFSRRSGGLALVAPRTGEPFATGDFVIGRANGRGASLELAVSGQRAAVQAAYGVQRLRYVADQSSWIPQFGTAQTVEGGVTLFPTPTFSISIGAVGAWGRRTTAVVGAFEWESCNLLDRGCEFGGTPRARSDALGATTLPAYFRADIGARKHWHFSLAAHAVELSLFGTVSNVSNRRSLLTRAIDPVTLAPTDIRMRPLAPLVVGLDWRF